MLPEYNAGSQFGSFTLKEVLGRGAESVVYRAWHPRLGRDLALKIYSEADESMATAALKIAEVKNAYAVPAYESGVTDGHAWLAMQYITGIDLHTWLRSRRPDLSDIVSLVRQLASALDAMHSSSLAHGDVKPSNIMLTLSDGRPDRVKALLADPVPAESKRMTLDYAAPERLRGEGPSAAADQYALATVVFECLTRQVPFPSATLEEAIGAHLTSLAPSILYTDVVAPFARDVFDSVLGTGLAIAPADRFASCGGLAAAMKRAEIASYASPPPYPTPAYGSPSPTMTGPPASRFGPARPDWGALSAAIEAPTGAHARPIVSPIGVHDRTQRPDWGAYTNIGSFPLESTLGAIRATTSVEVEHRSRAGVVDDVVDCSVFAPATINRTDTALVQVYVHLPDQAAQVATEAVEFDLGSSRRGVRTLEAPIARGERLAFDLSLPDLDVPDPVQSVLWAGRHTAVQFDVRVPPELPSPRSTVGTVSVSRAGIPLGSLKFKMAVAQEANLQNWSLVGDTATRYKKAFVSYASQDRAAVLARVQVLRAAQIEYFQDIDMDPGERWEHELYKQIDGCDLFLLFWSQAAKDSEWVRREVDYALSLGEAIPAIRPVVIEGPPAPSPWKELAQLHFDDRLLSMLAAASH